MGRRGRRLRHADHRGRVPVDAGRADRPAAGRVRLEPRDDRVRDLGQPHLLRARRPVRRGLRRALRDAARHDRRAARRQCRLEPDRVHERAVAARRPLGRRQRARDGCGRGPARGDDREPLVRRAPRPRHRRPDRVDRDRQPDLPARAGRDHRRVGLALHRGDRQRGRVRRRPAARGAPAARPPCRPRRCAVRRHRDRARARVVRNPFAAATSGLAMARTAATSGCSPAASSSAVSRRTG